MQEYCSKIKEDVYKFINIEKSLNSRKSYSGTAIDNVKSMIEYNKRNLN